jgi:hypothetical protein
VNKREPLRAFIRVVHPAVGNNPDWPTVLARYEAALEQFEQASKALTTALVDRGSGAEDFDALLAAEAVARDAVVLTRMRALNAWLASTSSDVDLHNLP